MSKHQQNSKATRERLIEAAEQLFGSRSIDAVSISEITAAAGQKNRNALQYHFKNRTGLLQAIVEKHSKQVALFRQSYFERAAAGEWPAADAAARCFVMPLVDYVKANPAAVNFVKIISQLSALNQVQGNNNNALGVDFPAVPGLRALLESAMQHLGEKERQQRIYFLVSITFHGVADACRLHEQHPPRFDRTIFEQLVCVLASFMKAESRA